MSSCLAAFRYSHSANRLSAPITWVGGATSSSASRMQHFSTSFPYFMHSTHTPRSAASHTAPRCVSLIRICRGFRTGPLISMT